MNKTQKAHLNRVTDQAMARLIDKYTAGVKEYQSTLSEDYSTEQLLNEIINEAIDQLVYALTALEVYKKERSNEQR